MKPSDNYDYTATARSARRRARSAARLDVALDEYHVAALDAARKTDEAGRVIESRADCVRRLIATALPRST